MDKSTEMRRHWTACVNQFAEKWYRTNSNTIIVHFAGQFSAACHRATAIFETWGAKIVVAYYDTLQDITKLRITEPPGIGGPLVVEKELKIPCKGPDEVH